MNGVYEDEIVKQGRPKGNRSIELTHLKSPSGFRDDQQEQGVETTNCYKSRKRKNKEGNIQTNRQCGDDRSFLALGYFIFFLKRLWIELNASFESNYLSSRHNYSTH